MRKVFDRLYIDIVELAQTKTAKVVSRTAFSDKNMEKSLLCLRYVRFQSFAYPLVTFEYNE